MASKANAGLLILVSDVEAHAVGPVQGYLDGKTITDALGRLWCSNSDAVVALGKANAAWQEEIQLRAEHRASLEDRAARRKALMQKISNDLGGGGTPESHARVYAAQREALEEFDRTNVELDYYTWRDSRSPMATR